ncbi:MAG: dimethylarginine dimethylaminohydrolase, partial [Pseudomonadota bacterium]
MNSSYRFTHAVTRLPAASAINGLRAEDVGAPDIDLLRRHHAEYVKALRVAGIKVTVLPALEAFPDSCFVEDAALCLPQGAILTRPGAESRLGEAAEMRPALETLYGDVRAIDGPGFLEAGDVLVTEREILVGLSARTDAAGAAELADLVADWGWTVRVVETPPDVLHFKTDCSLLDERTMLATERLARSGCFDDYGLIFTAEGEEASANAIRVNDFVLFPEGFPETASRLRRAGYIVREIG